MKFIDSNGRLFGKISIIDVLVLLAVAVLAVALYVKTSQREITATGQSDDTVCFQIYAKGVRSYVGDAVKTGDLLLEDGTSTNGALGEITDVQVLPGTKKATYPAEGTVDMNTPAEDCVDLLITVKGKGIYSGGQYMLNRVYALGVNANRNFCTKYALFAGVVWDILP